MTEQETIAAVLNHLGIMPSDLEMLEEYCGGDHAAPGPDRRLVSLARALLVTIRA